MNIKRYRLLHYVLIILMMIMPLRGVIAAQCDVEKMHMEEMGASSNKVVMHGAMAHDMSAMQFADEVQKHHCCDNASVLCSGICDLGINISLMPQQSFYSPVYTSSFKPVAFSSKILFRELTPPSRPPATLHSS
jgi:hypothetical protein